MNKAEAEAVLSEQLRELKALPYERLLQFRTPASQTLELPSGNRYQIEVQAFLDDKEKRTLRLMVSIDDAGLRSFAPMTDDFIIAPDGSLVGE